MLSERVSMLAYVISKEELVTKGTERTVPRTVAGPGPFTLNTNQD